MRSYAPSVEGVNCRRPAVRHPVFVCTLSTRSSGNGRRFLRTKTSRWSVGMLPSLPLGAGPVAVCRGAVATGATWATLGPTPATVFCGEGPLSSNGPGVLSTCTAG